MCVIDSGNIVDYMHCIIHVNNIVIYLSYQNMKESECPERVLGVPYG